MTLPRRTFEVSGSDKAMQAMGAGKESSVVHLPSSVLEQSEPNYAVEPSPGNHTVLKVPFSATTSPENGLHHFEINPEVTKAYNWHVPGSSQNVPFAFGGTEKEAAAAAKLYVQKHPGSTMYFAHTRHRLFGKPIVEVQAWTSNAKGALKKIPGLNSAGRPLQIPNPNEFLTPFNGN